MKNIIPSSIFMRLPETVLTVFRVCRAEGFSAAEIGDFFGIVPDQNIEIGITLPPKRF